MDTSGVSGNAAAAKLSKADLYILILKPDNSEEARKESSQDMLGALLNLKMKEGWIQLEFRVWRKLSYGR